MNLFIQRTQKERFTAHVQAALLHALKVNGDQTVHARFLSNNGLGPYTKLLYDFGKFEI